MTSIRKYCPNCDNRIVLTQKDSTSAPVGTCSKCGAVVYAVYNFASNYVQVRIMQKETVPMICNHNQKQWKQVDPANPQRMQLFCTDCGDPIRNEIDGAVLEILTSLPSLGVHVSETIKSEDKAG